MQILRPYQLQAIDNIRSAFAAGRKRVLLVAPTGAGKTTMFAEITRRTVAGGKRVLVLCHRKELIDQCSARLGHIPHGIIKAGYQSRAASVQVASIQTLRNRAKPVADVVIVDEAHRAKAKSWMEVLEFYPKALVLGFTATPIRLDGKPLGDLFEQLVLACTPTELVTAGFLVPITGFAYDLPDLSDVSKRSGEFAEEGAEAAMRPIMGNIVEQWKLHASRLSTVVFGVTIAHSKALAEQFRAITTAEHIDGSMGRKEREAILERVSTGQTQVICNVNVLSEGTDIPRLKCCVMARPTMSLALYLQSQGRVRRPWGGQIARIHDHAGNVFRHGLPDQEREWSLEGAQLKPGARTKRCRVCYAVFAPGQSCPAGCEVPTGERGARQIQFADGEQYSLEEVAERRDKSEVSWRKKGQSVVGEYIGAEMRMGKWGKEEAVHTLRGETKDFLIAESAGLRGKFAQVTEGQRVRVTYTDDVDVGRDYPMRAIKVERDE